MPKKYLVTGIRHTFLRTNYLTNAIETAKSHSYGFIHIFKSSIDGYDVMKEFIHGKEVPLGTIEKEIK